MTIDQLFIRLPRDLQWEILETFVGTHTVRNGKLRRKLKLNTISHELKYLIRNRPCYGWLYKRNSDEENKRIFAEFPPNGRTMMFFRDVNTDETIYLYGKQVQIHSVWDFKWKVRFTPINPNDLIVLPPFEKHVYPSYPYTNKKLGR